MAVTAHRCAANTVAEWSVQSGVDRADPYAAVGLHALVRDPQGRERRVPAFWRGGDRWSFRYASPLRGVHTWRTQCSDIADWVLILERPGARAVRRRHRPSPSFGPERIDARCAPG